MEIRVSESHSLTTCEPFIQHLSLIGVNFRLISRLLLSKFIWPGKSNWNLKTHVYIIKNTTNRTKRSRSFVKVVFKAPKFSVCTSYASLNKYKKFDTDDMDIVVELWNSKCCGEEKKKRKRKKECGREKQEKSSTYF